MTILRALLIGATTLGGLSGLANADIIDFSVAGDGVSPLVNGQSINGTSDFSSLFTLTSTGDNLGAALFDSTPGGVNFGGGDADLLVNMGNVLILQDTASPSQTTPGFWDTANDSNEGGALVFDFVAGLQVNALDVIDIDNGAVTTITLTDGNNLSRTVLVPNNFTGDPSNGAIGIATIDLVSGNTQESPEVSGLFTAVNTDNGFDSSNILKLVVDFKGSAAMDNLDIVTVPAPGALALLGLGLAGTRRRRRA